MKSPTVQLPAVRLIDKPTTDGRRRGAISIWIATVAIAILVAAPLMHADDPQPAARAVHLSYVEGQVRVTQGDQVIAEGATVNMPLFEGMQVSAGQDGRAEIQFEDGSVARLSPNSTLTLSVLRGEGTNGVAEMVLNGGLAYFEFEGGNQLGQFSVHFGDSSVTPGSNAVIRVKMDTPPGDLAVLSGNVDLGRGNGGLDLAMHGGESVTLYANDMSHYDLNESIEPDSWDAWNSDRDQATATEESAFTAPPPSQSGPESGSPAWSDLDANGSWYNVPGQGYVWSPFDASNSGFDPYGCGNWVWYPRYGYMYVPCNSWGFLPYSCGSWNFFNDFGWGWSPGMGGCNPWWNSYGYYPGPRYGSFPPGYRAPHRPIGPRGVSPGRPMPVIAVNRTPSSGGPVFPSREHNQPVMIGGNTVAPMRPVIARGGENRGVTTSTSSGYTIFDGSTRSDSSPGRAAYTSPHPGSSSSAYRAGSGSPGSPGSSRGTSSSHASSSGGSSHSSGGGGSSYHASSSGGGGGGGASHAGGGGGGGGGGGAPHK
ncbi:MAG: DUF6600 domain-containing protein [Terracidiphilus sp.]|jgi:hypothetical protein